MNPNQPQRKIPGILGLLVVLIGVGITVYLAGVTTNIFQHAAPPETPQNIRITNVSDTAFTLTYQTDTALIGTMTLGSGNDTQTILDDRDQPSGTPKPYALHSLSAKNLSPSTTYTFSILSGTTNFLNNGQKFSVTTAASISAAPSTQSPLAGKIIASDGTVPDEALLFVTTSNAQTVSTLVQPSGVYILPINTLRTKDLSSYVQIAPTTSLELLFTGTKDTAHAVISAGTSNPIPPITLGQDYDFTQSTAPIASSSATGGFPSFSLDTSLKATAQILQPAQDNQSFSDAQPLFKGKAQPNESVTITIHSDQAITKTVTADANGNWSYRPATPLSPGQHTITISTMSTAGIIETIQKSFTVYAAGSQVNQSATPSATIAAPTATPTPKNTPTPTPKVTTTLTPVPTTVSTGTPTPIPAKPAKLPPTGSNAATTIGIAGIATTLVGILIFVLTRGAML